MSQAAVYKPPPTKPEPPAPGYDDGMGTVKTCKGAVNGVVAGTPFIFEADGVRFTVLAGYCAIAGRYRVGSTITLTEVKSEDFYMESAKVDPWGRMDGTPDLQNGKIQIKVGTGITEVYITNVEFGYLEICKSNEAEGMFTFTLRDSAGAVQTITLPSGACSPAIKLRKGQVTITEAAAAGAVMIGCKAIPQSRLVNCDVKSRTETVTIEGGGLSNQSIAIFENRPSGRKPYPPAKPDPTQQPTDPEPPQDGAPPPRVN
jgi:hypothetical protein